MIDFSDMCFAQEPINRSKLQNNTSPEDLHSVYTLEQLHQYILFINHPLKLECKSTVIYSGNKNSPLMIVGEAPGINEDEQTLPFVGDSGKLLNKLLNLVGIDRDKVYVTNLVFFRPPFNRKPNREEINFFWPFLKRQIELQKPKVILSLGATATINFTSDPIAKARGKFYQYNSIPVLCSFHPSYLLRLPVMKTFAQNDFIVLKNFLVENNLFDQLVL